MSFWLNKMTQIGRKLVIRQRTANNNTYIGANQMETNWLSTIEVVSGACSLQQQACFNWGDDVIISQTLFYVHVYTQGGVVCTLQSVQKIPFSQNTEKKSVCFAKYSYLCTRGLKLPPTPAFASRASFTLPQILLCTHMQVTDTMNSAYTVSCDYTVFPSITSWLTPSHIHTIKPTQRNTLSNTHTYNESSRDPPLGSNQ